MSFNLISTLKMKVLVEGWLTYPHSYSIVNVYQLLALAKLPQLELYISELEPYREEWRKFKTVCNTVITAEEQKVLDNLERYDGKKSVDLVYRIAYPYDLSYSRGVYSDNLYKKVPLILFYTAEFQKLTEKNFVNGDANDFIKRCFDKRILPVTPSNYSAEALRKKKFDPLVIPHGVDVEKYKPLIGSERDEFRDLYDIPQDAFVFLNVGAMTGNKNVKLILKSFYKISLFKENVYLVLKGIGDLYATKENVNTALKQLVKDGSIPKKQWRSISHRLVYIDELYSYKEMCTLYNSCDCYLSPYLAEGFNLPVLESIACGTPVIVSKGGPTDDFTTNDFARYPKTFQCKSENDEIYLVVDEGSLQEKMLEMMEDTNYRAKAKIVGPAFVKRKFTWKHVAEKMFNFFDFITPDIMPNMINSCHSDLVSMQ